MCNRAIGKHTENWNLKPVTDQYRSFIVYSLSDALREKVKLEGVLVDTKN